VLAATERSPDWLFGLLRPLGGEWGDGALTGTFTYVALWVAMVAYVGVLACSHAIGPRLALGSIAGIHLLFMLAPPLLSQDVFSYLSYARLGVLHDLNPYTHSPDAVPWDAAYPYSGSHDATSVYGPLFTLASYPLAKLSVPAAFWTLKAVMAAASMAIVLLVRRCARVLGRDPVFASLVVGLNPLVLVHVVGGAHNDALVVLLWLAAVTLVIERGRQPLTGALAGVLAGAATAVKASAALVTPYLFLGARRRTALVLGGVLGAVVAVAASLPVFGFDALDAFVELGDNQDRTSRWSLPQRAADGIALVFGGSADSIVDFTRAVFAAGFLVAIAYLLLRSWRSTEERDWLDAAGWATFALLVASAWLVPWYAIWLLPLAALSRSRALLVCSLVLCAYMLVIAVPL
jgi:hypothetical protein